MTKTRTETDSFGPLEVPSDKYWGAQTQRSIQNFPIGWEKQPVAIVRALGVVKQAAAQVNMATGNLDPTLSAEIMELFASLPERGTSVLVASHDLGLVKRMKKRVLVLDHGKLADDIAPEDLADE